MQDFLKKYKKQKLLSNVNIILASLVLAVWVNFYIVWDTNIWKQIKTSVLNSQWTEIQSDIYVDKLWETFYVLSNKTLSDVTDMSVSLIYNPENVVLGDITSNYWDVTSLNNTPGMSSLILNIDSNTNIKQWDKLFEINLTKLQNQVENINVINANFTDWEEEIYLLSTSWLTF